MPQGRIGSTLDGARAAWPALERIVQGVKPASRAELHHRIGVLQIPKYESTFNAVFLEVHTNQRQFLWPFVKENPCQVDFRSSQRQEKRLNVLSGERIGGAGAAAVASTRPGGCDPTPLTVGAARIYGQQTAIAQPAEWHRSGDDAERSRTPTETGGGGSAAPAANMAALPSSRWICSRVRTMSTI